MQRGSDVIVFPQMSRMNAEDLPLQMNETMLEINRVIGVLCNLSTIIFISYVIPTERRNLIKKDFLTTSGQSPRQARGPHSFYARNDKLSTLYFESQTSNTKH